MSRQSFYEWCIENKREDLIDQWDKEKNGPLTPQTVTSASNKSVWWRLPYDDERTGKHFCFEWQASPNARKGGTNCPYLSVPPRAVKEGFNDLATQYPEIAKEWNYVKNGDLKPTAVVAKSGKKVWWIKKYEDPLTKKIFDFEWEASIQSRTVGNGCPYITNKKLYSGFNDLATRFPELAEEWSEENELKPTEVLFGSTLKVKWVCRRNPTHKWEAAVYSRTKYNSDCPYCASQKVMKGFNDLATTDALLAQEWSNENIIKPTHITRGSTRKIKWICPVNPLHKYEATPNDRTSGKNCPYCAGRRILPGDNDLQTLYPDVASEWDYEKNGDLKPTMISAHNMRKIWWRCPKGHSYDMEVANKIKDGINCPICSNKRLLSGYNDLATLYPDIAEEWSKENTVSANQVIAGSSMRGMWVCRNNPKHKWEATVSNRTFNKTGCPFCNVSHGEILISSILSKMDANFKIQYRFENCYAIETLPFDFAVIKLGRVQLIEYDGIQHFDEKDFFGGSTGFKVLRNHDNTKNKYCAENDIPLLRIPYIYDPQRDQTKIEAIVRGFVEMGHIPDEIIDFYKQQPVNNYYEFVIKRKDRLPKE